MFHVDDITLYTLWENLKRRNKNLFNADTVVNQSNYLQTVYIKHQTIGSSPLKFTCSPVGPSWPFVPFSPWAPLTPLSPWVKQQQNSALIFSEWMFVENNVPLYVHWLFLLCCPFLQVVLPPAQCPPVSDRTDFESAVSTPTEENNSAYPCSFPHTLWLFHISAHQYSADSLYSPNLMSKKELFQIRRCYCFPFISDV